ncbi:hypothetical protein RI367_005674 [Sorochytrium milnesiophthora]
MSKKKSSSQASSSRRAETPAHSAADDSPLVCLLQVTAHAAACGVDTGSAMQKPDFASWDIGQLRKYNQAFKIGSSKRTSATQAELVNGVKKHYSSLSENINETETILYFLYSLKRRGPLSLTDVQTA